MEITFTMIKLLEFVKTILRNENLRVSYRIVMIGGFDLQQLNFFGTKKLLRTKIMYSQNYED